MTLQRQELGKSGEDLAVAELERRGYAILARRYRTRHGEIDVVARDGETTVFVEVKARTTAEFGTAAEAVTRSKQRRLVSMATDYLARHRLTDVRAGSTWWRSMDAAGGRAQGGHALSERVRRVKPVCLRLRCERVVRLRASSTSEMRAALGLVCMRRRAGITQW